MKRPPLFKLLVFIVLSAIVNVAVAWGCAGYLDAPLGRFPGGWVQTTEWERLVPSHWPPAATCERREGGGRVLIETEAGEYVARSHREYRQLVYQYGWPVLSLECENRWDPINGRQILDTAGHFTDMPLISKAFLHHFIPLRPIWPGFAINTIFYAAILWLLFAAPFALRRYVGGRRIKRGLCPACAYPIGSSDNCTECGKPLDAHCGLVLRGSSAGLR